MTIDSQAVALASHLVKMAGLFEREASGWGDYPRVAEECARALDLLTDEARYVIRTGDLTHGESWLLAAGMVITNLQQARLFRDGTAWRVLL